MPHPATECGACMEKAMRHILPRPTAAKQMILECCKPIAEKLEADTDTLAQPYSRHMDGFDLCIELAKWAGWGMQRNDIVIWAGCTPKPPRSFIKICFAALSYLFSAALSTFCKSSALLVLASAEASIRIAIPPNPRTTIRMYSVEGQFTNIVKIRTLNTILITARSKCVFICAKAFIFSDSLAASVATRASNLASFLSVRLFQTLENRPKTLSIPLFI